MSNKGSIDRDFEESPSRGGEHYYFDHRHEDQSLMTDPR